MRARAKDCCGWSRTCTGKLRRRRQYGVVFTASDAVSAVVAVVALASPRPAALKRGRVMVDGRDVLNTTMRSGGGRDEEDERRRSSRRSPWGAVRARPTASRPAAFPMYHRRNKQPPRASGNEKEGERATTHGAAVLHYSHGGETPCRRVLD
ncbi:hypothetical protein MTO96_046683 [Rhipicephalus appendiculatus]